MDPTGSIWFHLSREALLLVQIYLEKHCFLFKYIYFCPQNRKEVREEKLNNKHIKQIKKKYFRFWLFSIFHCPAYFSRKVWQLLSTLCRMRKISPKWLSRQSIHGNTATSRLLSVMITAVDDWVIDEFCRIWRVGFHCFIVEFNPTPCQTADRTFSCVHNLLAES